MPVYHVATRRRFIRTLAAVPSAVAINSFKLQSAVPGRVEDVRDSGQEQRIAEHATFVATFTPKQDQELAVEKILREMTAPTRREPGCLRYDLYQVSGSPTAFVLFEIYTDETAHQAHRATAHYKAFRAAITDLLSSNQAQVLRGLDVVP